MLSGILLAGGKSTRMNRNKAFIKYKHRYLYEYPLEILRYFASDILISSPDPRFSKTGFVSVPDETPDAGPLGGLYTCLKKIKNEYALVLPCDLPLLSTEIIQLLLQDHAGYEASVILNKNGQPEPLVAIYSKNIIPQIETRLNALELKLQNLLDSVSTSYVKVPQKLLGNLININTPEDLGYLNK